MLAFALPLTAHCVRAGVVSSTKQKGAEALVQPVSAEVPVLSLTHLTQCWYVVLAGLVVSQISLPEAVLPAQCED